MMANCVLLTSKTRCFALAPTNSFSFSRFPQHQVESSLRSLVLHTLKRSLSNTVKKHSATRTMEAWYINEYGSNDVLKHGRQPLPSLLKSTDILVQVYAASVNPIDYRMRSGYGDSLLNVWRKLENVKEFPLILGRDFSGEVVKTGRLARRFGIGDQVWGTPSVIAVGTHGQFVVASQEEMSTKPSNWTHTEAASLPYVACTVWTALVSRAGLKPDNCHCKHVLVLGGSGGIGSFAIQLLKAWGAFVTSTCSTDAVELVGGLGADHVVDYSAADMKKQLESLGGFDVILDPFGGEVGEQYTSLLSKWKGAIYVTLAPPLLSDTDEYGAGVGLLSAGKSLTSSALQKALCSGSLVSWGFFSPNGAALDYIRSLCQSGMIKPVIQEVFPFSKTKEAYAKLESGHSRGKIVVDMFGEESSKRQHSV